MAMTFSADEVFEIAEKIEREAADYYQKAAKAAKDKEAGKVFSDFSAMETEHADTFAKMRQDLDQIDQVPTTFDPDGEVVLYLQSFAQAHGWEGKSAQKDEFSGNETPQQILQSALGAEKNSVSFYMGIRNLVAREESKKQIDNIIKEEMQHIGVITAKLAALKS